jgi:ribosomal protein L11 methyltransferase
LLASRDNAERNGVSARFTLQLDSPTDPADGLLANILAGPLAELAPTFARLVKPGGWIVLSGILQNQAPALVQTYAAWFDMEAPVYREDWARLSGRRRPKLIIDN